MHFLRNYIEAYISKTISLAFHGRFIFLFSFLLSLIQVAVSSLLTVGLLTLLNSVFFVFVSVVWLGLKIYLLLDAKEGKIQWNKIGIYSLKSFRYFWPLLIVSIFILPFLLGFIYIMMVRLELFLLSPDVISPVIYSQTTNTLIISVLTVFTILIQPFLVSFAPVVIILKTSFFKAIPKTFFYLQYNITYYFTFIVMATFLSLIHYITRSLSLSVYVSTLIFEFLIDLIFFITTCFAVTYISENDSLPSHITDSYIYRRLFHSTIFFTLASLVLFQFLFLFNFSKAIGSYYYSRNQGVGIMSVNGEIGSPNPLEDGDRIRYVNGRKMFEPEDITKEFKQNAGQIVELVLSKNGVEKKTQILIPVDYPNSLVRIIFESSRGLQARVSKMSFMSIVISLLFHLVVAIALGILMVLSVYSNSAKSKKLFYVAVITFGFIFTLARIIGV